MSPRVETVVIGGGQAGLSTSYHLGRRGREHVVLEQAAHAGNAWRNGRWDSFTLVTPNWSFLLPGAGYDGDAPDGFMPRDEIVARLERYVEDFGLPVRYGVRATSVERKAGNDGYIVRTDAETIEAANVVVATGLFQRAKMPALSADLAGNIEQLHSGEYRDPSGLRDGAVLVVGSAQSGCQIAQELYQSGRRVYLCVGGAGRVPRPDGVAAACRRHGVHAQVERPRQPRDPAPDSAGLRVHGDGRGHPGHRLTETLIAQAGGEAAARFSTT